MTRSWQISGPEVIDVGADTDPVRTLQVGLVGGRVDVVAQDGPGARVEVTSARGRHLEVTWADGVLVVRHPHVRWDGLLDALKGFARGEDCADLRITTPRAAVVRLSTGSADGTLTGLRAAATLRTVSGDLTVGDQVGDVAARTVSGRIDLRSLTGSVTGETVSGSLTVQATSLPRLDVKTVSGALVVDLGQAPSTVSLKSVSGDLTVRIPPGAGYRLDARSVSGQIVADGRRLGATRPGPPQGEVRSGDESVHISANSVSGDVTLHRSDPA
jgi:Putative adhesin